MAGADALLTWLVRYGHVLAAAAWVGGYLLLAAVLVPGLRRSPGAPLAGVVMGVLRLLSGAGVATILLGVVLVARSRGVGSLLRGEWGAIVLAALVIAVVLMGLGDAVLRPAVRRLATGGDGGAATRWAVVGAVLSVLAVGIMTRAVYAPN